MTQTEKAIANSREWEREAAFDVGRETWEPRFREALAFALKAMKQSETENCWREEFARIDAILKGLEGKNE